MLSQTTLQYLQDVPIPFHSKYNIDLSENKHYIKPHFKYLFYSESICCSCTVMVVVGMIASSNSWSWWWVMMVHIRQCTPHTAMYMYLWKVLVFSSWMNANDPVCTERTVCKMPKDQATWGRTWCIKDRSQILLVFNKIETQ